VDPASSCAAPETPDLSFSAVDPPPVRPDADGKREDQAMQLEGKVALVTGAGSNLGKVYAFALAKEGAAVVIGDLDGELAKSAAQELRDTGARAIGLEMDMGNEAHIEAAVQRTIAEFGGVDILVNNAGLARGRWNLLSELSNEEWRQIMWVNVVAPLVCARAVRPSMAARGGGVIINQSSNAAYAFLTGAYGVSKLAISGMTVALAHEFGADNLRVNGIAPGVMNGRIPPEVLEMVVNRQILKRRGCPEDLAGVVVFLATDASSFMTGQTVIVDGGPGARP
jgi:NAD(P)-dependent dehydrogenase (short-subunit alcohol dehydrogenase family)